jgi:hypothetical protein
LRGDLCSIHKLNKAEPVWLQADQQQVSWRIRSLCYKLVKNTVEKQQHCTSSDLHALDMLLPHHAVQNNTYDFGISTGYAAACGLLHTALGSCCRIVLINGSALRFRLCVQASSMTRAEHQVLQRMSDH